MMLINGARLGTRSRRARAVKSAVTWPSLRVDQVPSKGAQIRRKVNCGKFSAQYLQVMIQRLLRGVLVGINEHVSSDCGRIVCLLQSRLSVIEGLNDVRLFEYAGRAR